MKIRKLPHNPYFSEFCNVPDMFFRFGQPLYNSRYSYLYFSYLLIGRGICCIVNSSHQVDYSTTVVTGNGIPNSYFLLKSDLCEFI